MLHDPAHPSVAARIGARPRRVLVILNPAARAAGSARWPAVLEALSRHGCEVTVRTTAGPGDATRFAVEVRAGDYDVVAIAGGDGTINEALDGLGEGVAMVAIVPLGTANVAALEIGLSLDAEAVARAIAGGRAERAHLGRVNGRSFLMMAGAGFDAAVVAAVRPGIKRRLGRWAYVLESARLLFRYRPQALTVTVDGAVHQAASVVIGNGHFYGGRFVCTPDARLEEAGFQVCLGLGMGRLSIVRYAAALGLGILPRLRDVRLLRARRIRIDGPAGAPVQADGEIVARLPVDIDVAPRTIRLLHP
ncbi:MAG: diacylglycerol kinase family protein [Rhodospirillaceae bacterium]